MRLVCTPQIPATHLTWRSKRGELTHTIICKATYTLAPVEALLAQDHEPIHEGDQHWEDSEHRSLRAASDLAPFKRRADVVVVGAVFAPPGTTSRRVIARIAVGDIDKSLVAHCDRSAGRDGLLVEGRAFSRMPLVYERARGGDDTDNPVGRTSARNNVGQLLLPNLQPVAFEPEAPDFFVPSIGLGPIAAIWPSRTLRLGAHAALPPEALLERAEDFDASFFNVAPLDQQLDELPSNAHLVLEGLNADHPRLVTRLPGHRARALVDIAGIDINLVCDTLWIDTERAICTLTWRGSFRAESIAADERVIVALEGADMRRSAEVLRKSVSGEETLTLKPRKTMALPERSALPFANAAANGGSFVSTLAGTPFQSGPPSTRQVSEAPPAQAPRSPLPPPPARASSPMHAAVSAPSHEPPLPQLVSQPPMFASPPTSSGIHPALSLAQPPPPIAAQASPHPPIQAAPIQATAAPAYLSAPRPPPVAQAPIAHDPRAASRGVASASDAAAQSGAAPLPKAARAEPQPAAPAAKRPRSFIDLLWFEGSAVERIRAQGSWSNALKGGSKSSPWLTDTASGEAAKREIEPQRFVARAMTRISALDANGVQQAIVDAVDEDGFLVRPLVVVEGDLAFVYSPMETLRITIALAEPLGGTDKRLKDQLDAAIDIAKPDRKSSTGAIEGAISRVRAAFQAVNKVYPQGYLETTCERALIEERAYAKRVVLGGPKLVATLSPATGGMLSIYLPEQLADRLPLLPRFKARLIAEPHARQDAADGEGIVLVALALGRVVAPSNVIV